MTEMLARAVAEAEKLLPEDQDSFASVMLDVLDSDRKWDELLVRPESLRLMDEMAEEARKEIALGQTQSLEEWLGEKN